MKLDSRFITHRSEGEHIMVGTDGVFSGLVKSNSTAAFIVDCLENDTTEAEITAKMAEKYDAPKEVIERDVRKILDKLRSIGAIDE